ncbi:MAG: substrate-binding periplasmic protein [Christensenellales bacterium]
MTVATSPDWPPYEYIDDDGNIVGTDILMCQWMAEQLGVELEIQPMAFDACLAAVGQGDVDMMVAGLTYDENRLARMELTGIYWNEGDQGVLVKKGTGASTTPLSPLRARLSPRRMAPTSRLWPKNSCRRARPLSWSPRFRTA